jgi:uroporphyrin-III C-methyltransferase
VPAAILALAARAQKVAVGKRCGKHSTAQRFINKQLVDAARKHHVVVRLKGGDPMLFGRAHEEISFLLEKHISVEVVPGVTAALAAAAEARVSLTRRGVSRSVVFATTRAAEGAAPSRWAEAVAAADTAVLYMAARDAGVVRDALLQRGMKGSTPVAVAENASLPAATVFPGTLQELPALVERCSGGPAVLLIGEVFAETSLAAASTPNYASLLAISGDAQGARR